MSDMQWQDPPAPKPGTTAARLWQPEAEALKEHPKRWALLKTFPAPAKASTFKFQSMKGQKRAFRPPEHWEFRVAGADLYVRYLGEDGAA